MLIKAIFFNILVFVVVMVQPLINSFFLDICPFNSLLRSLLLVNIYIYIYSEFS